LQDREQSLIKADELVSKLEMIRLYWAAEKVRDNVEETLSYTFQLNPLYQ